jgi:hypothetical protein
MPIGQALPSHSVIVPRKGVTINQLRRKDKVADVRADIAAADLHLQRRIAAIQQSLRRSWLMVVSLTIAAYCRRIPIKRWKPAAIC